MIIFHRKSLALFFACSWLVLTHAAPAWSDKEVAVEGFRSAKFGMSQSELLKAIAADFKIPESKVIRNKNPREKTATILIDTADLVSDSGPARIAYVFGYKSGKLFRVSITWGHPIEANPDGKVLIGTANLLRNYFIKKGFPKDTVLINARLKDGTIIVFRGKNAQGRMVLLQLNNPADSPDAKDKDKKELAKRMSLRLTYIDNPTSPDIFQIKEDDF